MQITFLSLRNFRVFATLDLEVPPGLVGVYGPNGAGKSTLLEAILWALYGRARTGKADIRTSGSSGECSVELSFVHEDHHYVVRRSISGVNSTVKARVEVGGNTVADGPTEVGRFLRSTLGMEEAAFRSSVFAEQKQLAAFSDSTPETRRRLVLQLLGITPIEKARDAARSDARAKRADHERLLHLLPDVNQLEERVRSGEEAAASGLARFHNAKVEHERASEAVAAIEASLRALEGMRATHALITQKGKSARAERDRAAASLAPLETELVALLDAEDALASVGSGRPEAERERDARRLATLDQVIEAASALARLATPESADGAPLVDRVSGKQQEVVAARALESERKSELSAANAFLSSATDAAQRAFEALERSAALTSEADCPLCGQELGPGFTAVQQHRIDDHGHAKASLGEAKSRVAASKAALTDATKRLQSAERELAELTVQLEKTAAGRAKRTAAAERLADLHAAMGPSTFNTPQDERTAVAAALREDRSTDERRAVLKAQLGRLPALQMAIATERRSLEAADAERSRLRAELDELHFDARLFATLDQQRNEAGESLQRASNRLQDAATVSAKAEQEVASARALFEQATIQHQAAETLAEEVRYIGRSADLLHGFRQQVVAAIGPRLEVQASELFNVLTAGEYDGMKLDPESYEISIIDAGVPYLSTRFSGSEVDLANLALRVAISEQVRFQAGGQVGLLVLDEALASLDVDRKDRMLGALTQLSGRFRQILVVTHAPEVKERLPQAIEVVKLAGRRATARVVEVGAS